MVDSLKPKQKICPRCKVQFECNASDVSNCQCSQVSLSEDASTFLARTAYDCLCKKCLDHFNELLETSRGMVFPTQREMMIEGIHFYKERGNFVFTELYHLLRGSCCGSGCRHCIYGYKNVVG